jgi:AcrR family transcriptional regulator
MLRLCVATHHGVCGAFSGRPCATLLNRQPEETRMTSDQDTRQPRGTAQLPQPAPLQRPGELLRADAQQNRDRLIEVAREALAASADASLNSIAKRAGVGAGTLYRHFPTREALVLAVYRYDVQQLADAAPALLADHPPLTAMRLWFDRLARDGRINHGLADALQSATTDGPAAEVYGPVTGAIAQLLAACEQAGCIRPGLGPDDLLLLLGFLWRAGEAGGPVSLTASSRPAAVSLPSAATGNNRSNSAHPGWHTHRQRHR